MRKLSLVLAVVIAPALASAATPPEGVALTVRRGFFTETDIGGFMTLGGNDQYSNLQTYLQLGIGYDVSQTIELGLHVGIGANAANCHNGKDAKTGACLASDNFTVTFLSFTGAYLFKLAERFYFAPKIVGGYTLMEPAPINNGQGCSSAPPAESCVETRAGPHAGAALGVEYATTMDHFTIGFDVYGRFIIGANIITLQFFPRVKYTF